MLHSDTIEILLPKEISPGDDLPAILSIGPSVTIMVPVVLMALLSSRIYGSNGNNYMLMTLVMGAGSALTGLIWGISNYVIRRKKHKEKVYKSESEFERYLEGLRDMLLTYREDNIGYMFERYPQGIELLAGDGATRFLKDEDYLFLRLGLGESPFQVTLVKQERKEMFPDKSSRLADELIEEFRLLKKVPVGVDFSEISRLGLEGDGSYSGTYEFILEMIFKIALSYESSKVKICLLYDMNNEYQERLYETVKFLPHLFLKGTAVRMCAGDEEGGNRIIPELTELIEDSKYILFIFVLNESLLKGENLKEVIYGGNAKDIKVITLASQRRLLPVSFRNILKLPEEGLKEAYYYEEGNRKSYSKIIVPDKFANVINHHMIGTADMNIRRMISNIEFQNSKEEYIPQNVDFMELFDARKIEEIDIDGHYNNNHSSNRLKVPIGIGTGREKIYLDVHEKFHGPHGLIAGTTGSGKSELLQTYLISLCICYSPREVNFFLIDYKGGGTGNYICNLPHCAGVISNLSGNDIQRAMEAIKAENRRRQQLFSDYEVNHIDAYGSLYKEGIARDFLPHLILIIDEFAELKKEEPEFMQQIISLAAVGRSLGIHLILATQKPQGVVDDKIWSNSKFKLCLKVQDKQDSMDMLHRKEAAYLRAPGECYMQIGNDEYLRCFKAGYCGGIYYKDVRRNETNLILETGNRIPASISSGNKGDTLLECLVDYVNQYCRGKGYEKAKLLWMDELPTCIELNREALDLCKPSGPIVELGIYDDPACVLQDKAYYCPATDGHLAVAGSLSTGKSNVLKCIIAQIRAYPFMLVSMSESDLNYASKCPNCLGALSTEPGIPVFLYHLSRLNTKQETVHFVLIDNFASFYKALSEEEAQVVLRAIQEGIGNNIYYVLTGSMLSDFPTKIYSKIKTALCLEMNDKYQYCDIMRSFRLNVLPKGGVQGRCLYKVGERIMETQIYDATEAFERTVNGDLNAEPYQKLPMYQPDATPREMIEAIRNEEACNSNIMPIGYSLKTGYIRGIDISHKGSFIISGCPGSGRHRLMANIKMMIDYFPPSIGNNVIFIDDMSDTTLVDELLPNHCLPGDKYIIAIVNPQSLSELILNPVFKEMISYGEGIHLGPNASSQRIIAVDDLSYKELSVKSVPGVGFMRLHGRNKTIKIKIPYEKKEGDWDDYD